MIGFLFAIDALSAIEEPQQQGFLDSLVEVSALLSGMGSSMALMLTFRSTETMC